MRRTPRKYQRLRLAALATVAVLTAGVAFCSPGHSSHQHGLGEDTRSDQRVESSGEALVQIADYGFRPGNLQVSAGTSITWVNRDAVAHTATAVDESWDTGMLASGESFAIRFDVPGIYEYFCVPHPAMKARVEVAP